MRSVNPSGEPPKDVNKEALDKQTSYYTLLPHMDEGFHTGYQPVPGVVCDFNRYPREWLENLARYMQTPGEEVGYSIPDVLAAEQQLRRLSRLPYESAMRHQEMLNYRAVLALLLLWDSWPKDDTWPTLSCRWLDGRDKPFTASVFAALSPRRARGGVCLFTLSRERAELMDARPLCTLSGAMILTPAANPGDLDDMLPARVTWYDRKRQCFNDPCGFLDERDLCRLVAQLRLLQALQRDALARSAVYSPDSRLTLLLERFADDLTARRNAWRNKLDGGDEEAARSLHTRILAVHALPVQLPDNRVREERLHFAIAELRKNPLISALLPAGYTLSDDTLREEEAVIYLFDGVPFARRSDAYLLEPTYAAGEAEALARLTGETALLDRYNADWNKRANEVFAGLYGSLKDSVGISRRVLSLLENWAANHADYPAQSERAITLKYPMKEHPAALFTLLKDMLLLEDEACVRMPFADCLLLIDGAKEPPFPEPLASTCRLSVGADGQPRYAVAPLSPAMCAWLENVGTSDDAPRLMTDSFRCQPDESGKYMMFSFRVVRRVREGDAFILNTVTFQRVYALVGRAAEGCACVVSAPLMPGVTVWPNVRMPSELWKQYYVYVRRPENIDVWVLDDGGWSIGTQRTAVDEGAGLRAWRTARTSRFPAYLALKRGELSLGALINDIPSQPLRRDAAAVVSIDFGSIATTVMLRQDDQVQPASLPRCLHRTLLNAVPDDARYLADEFLPRNALLPGESAGTFYSLMDMFAEQPEDWRRVLEDGHIYYRESLPSLLEKNENTLYYDLKWGEEDYRLHLIRLFMKQVMVQASLSARLFGAPSVSWRVSMPNAMPAYRQEAYLELMRGQAREAADETGVPLTSGVPAVLYTSENHADGLYFLSRNEVNAGSGYINMDIGGGTTDISLWLRRANRAAAECSLMLGCRQMLFDSISLWHIDLFEQDFADAPEGVRRAAMDVAAAVRRDMHTARGRQKCMLLTDDFFAVCAADIRQAMAGARTEGRISYLECLLLFNFGFLFAIVGELLSRACQDPELRERIPANIEICIAGNGGQLLKILSDDQRERLCRLALTRVGHGRRPESLVIVQSRHPKREVAIGLLSDESVLQSSVQSEGTWNGTFPPKLGEENCREDMLKPWLLSFYSAFPQAAKRLAPLAFTEENRQPSLTPAAVNAIDNIFQNESFKTPEDDVDTYARCFVALKRLWRI